MVIIIVLLVVILIISVAVKSSHKNIDWVLIIPGTMLNIYIYIFIPLPWYRH